MAELVALYIICKNVGVIARSRGVAARPYQARAVLLWFLFEIACGFVAAVVGMQGIAVYLAALAGALLSLRFSFGAVRAAVPRRSAKASHAGKKTLTRRLSLKRCNGRRGRNVCGG